MPELGDGKREEGEVAVWWVMTEDLRRTFQDVRAIDGQASTECMHHA